MRLQPLNLQPYCTRLKKLATPFASGLDPRLALALTVSASYALWQAEPLILFLFAITLCWLWNKQKCSQRITQGTLKRAVRFCFIWSTIYLCMEYANESLTQETLFTVKTEQFFTLLTASGLQPLKKAAILFSRFYLQLILGLCLTLCISTKSLGQALSWYLRPFLRKHAWKAAVGIALMTHFLPLIFQTFAASKLAAKSRGLPEHGWQYWCYALPQVYRLLFTKSQQQAIGFSSRQLDQATMWLPPKSPPWQDIGASLLLIICIISLVRQ